MRMDTNLLLIRLIGKPEQHSWGTAIRLAGGIGLIAIVVTFVSLLASNRWGVYTLSILFIAVIGVNILTPVVVSLIAVNLTLREVENGEYDLIRVSVLPDNEFVSSYITAAMYRSRYWLAVMAGLTTAIITPGILFLPFLFFIAYLLGPFVISAWGFVRLASAMGVESALKNHRRWPPMIFTPLLVFIEEIIFIGIMLISSGATLGIFPLVGMLIPFAMAANARGSAQYWVRKT